MFSFFRVASSSSFSSAFGVGFSSSSAEPNLSFILYESRPLNKSLFPPLHLRGQHCPRSGGWMGRNFNQIDWRDTPPPTTLLSSSYPLVSLPKSTKGFKYNLIKHDFLGIDIDFRITSETLLLYLLLLLLLRIRHRHSSAIHQQHRQIIVLFLFSSFHLCPDLIVDSARGTLQRTIQHDTLTLHPGAEIHIAQPKTQCLFSFLFSSSFHPFCCCLVSLCELHQLKVSLANF